MNEVNWDVKWELFLQRHDKSNGKKSFECFTFLQPSHEHICIYDFFLTIDNKMKILKSTSQMVIPMLCTKSTSMTKQTHFNFQKLTNVKLILGLNMIKAFWDKSFLEHYNNCLWKLWLLTPNWEILYDGKIRALTLK
jgi:hypothetical protein